MLAPYREGPHTKTGRVAVRLSWPGSTRAAIVPAIFFVAVAFFFIRALAWVSIDCDSHERTCVVAESRIGSVQVTKIFDVTGATFEVGRNVTHRPPNTSIVFHTTGGDVVHASTPISVTRAREIVEQISPCDPMLAFEPRGSETVATFMDARDCAAKPVRPHIAIAPTGGAIVMTFLFVVGLLVTAYLAFRAALGAHRGVRVMVDHDRGVVVVHGREIPIVDLVGVIVRASDFAGPHTLAIVAELYSGELIALTPFGVDHRDLLEPSRRALVRALDLPV